MLCFVLVFLFRVMIDGWMDGMGGIRGIGGIGQVHLGS